MYQPMVLEPINGFLSQLSNTDVIQVQTQPNGVSQSIQCSQKIAKSLGITQMIVGIICLISNIVILTSARSGNSSSIVAYGIWGGILFFIAGLLEVLSASKTPNMRLIIGAMVMSIIAACISGVVFSMGSIEAFLQNTSYNRDNSSHDVRLANLAFAIIMVISALVEAVSSITSSALHCAAFCRKFSSNTLIPFYIAGNQPALDYQPDHPSDTQVPLSPIIMTANNPPPGSDIYDEIN